MKTFKSMLIKALSLALVVCILFLTSCQAIIATKEVEQDNSLDEQTNPFEGNLDVEYTQPDEDTAMYTYTGEGQMLGVSHNNKTGEFFYTDEDGTFPLNVTGINEDGIIHWQVDKGDSLLEGEVNTMDAATPQAFSFAIAGGIYVVSSFLACLFKAALVVTIAYTTCYLASAVGQAIRDRSSRYNYFPAYQAFNNVYVASGIGISQATAVQRIKYGQNVWAKNATYAKKACVLASPIGKAVWNWHGNRKTNSGYYQHYHAIKYYKNNGSYVHTGAHCWYM